MVLSLVSKQLLAWMAYGRLGLGVRGVTHEPSGL